MRDTYEIEAVTTTVDSKDGREFKTDRKDREMPLCVCQAKKMSVCNHVCRCVSLLARMVFYRKFTKQVKLCYNAWVY